MQPNGSIHLNQLRRSDNESAVCVKGRELTVRVKDRKYELRADSDGDAQDWANTINAWAEFISSSRLSNSADL